MISLYDKRGLLALDKEPYSIAEPDLQNVGSLFTPIPHWHDPINALQVRYCSRLGADLETVNSSTAHTDENCLLNCAAKPYEVPACPAQALQDSVKKMRVILKSS